MFSHLPKDRTLEMEDRWKIWKKISPPIPHLLQAQQALALLYAKVAWRPALEATQHHRPTQPPTPICTDCFCLTTVAKHMTNDVCFVDIMEAAILKNLLAWRRFPHFYDAEKHLLRNKWSSGVFKQHYLINQFDLLRKICFVCAYKAEPNSNRSKHFISTGQEEGRTKASVTHRLRPRCNLFATDFIATNWRSLRPSCPYLEWVYDRRLICDRFCNLSAIDWRPIGNC